MPKIKQYIEHDISLQRFVDECNPVELQELALLLMSPAVQNRIRDHIAKITGRQINRSGAHIADSELG